MVLMEKGTKKKFVADAMVDMYKKKGFAVSGETPDSAEEPGEAEETAAEEPAAKKTTSRKKTASAAE